MVKDGASYGNVGGAGDLLLSIITFGIYALAKSSKIDQKRAAVEAAIRQLNQQIPTNGSIIFTRVEGKVLSISENPNKDGGTDLLIAYDGKNVGLIQNTKFAAFKEQLEAEITLMPKSNEPDPHVL
ncbi:PIN domain-containing protein [Paraburkholderia sp. RL17-373-BIF-A]|uniref:hypothetical protein n=1 Tax=Paraburkholderia sp. RL17-373-BIF-A TaxID=3031629 RepID=UPI0038BBC773